MRHQPATSIPAADRADRNCEVWGRDIGSVHWWTMGHAVNNKDSDTFWSALKFQTMKSFFHHWEGKITMRKSTTTTLTILCQSSKKILSFLCLSLPKILIRQCPSWMKIDPSLPMSLPEENLDLTVPVLEENLAHSLPMDDENLDLNLPMRRNQFNFEFSGQGD